MKVIKQNSGSATHIVISETETHYIGTDLSNTVVSGTDKVSAYIYPKSGYTEVGEYSVTPRTKEDI